jgi:hypothetical protein
MEFKEGDEIRTKRMFSKAWRYGTIQKVGIGVSHAYGERLVHDEYEVLGRDGETFTADVWDTIELITVLDRLANIE